MISKSSKTLKKEESLKFSNLKMSMIPKVLKQSLKIRTVWVMDKNKEKIYMALWCLNSKKTTFLLDNIKITRKMASDIIISLMDWSTKDNIKMI